MNSVYLFLASFLIVFLLGVQQFNVQHRRYLGAMLTSFFIATSNYFIFKVLPIGAFEVSQFLGYSLGGSFGIIAAMWLHDKISDIKTK